MKHLNKCNNSSEENCEYNLKNDRCKCKPNTDYYDILSVYYNCNPIDVKEKVKNFISQYDLENLNEDVLSQFHGIAEAFEVLSNPITKLIYDNFGAEGLANRIPEPYGWAETFKYHGKPLTTFMNVFGPNKFCSDHLTDPVLLEECARPKQTCCKGETVIKNLYLTLKEVFYGGLKKIPIKKRVIIDPNTNKTETRTKVLNIAIRPGLPTGTKIIFPEEGDQAPFTIPGDIIFMSLDRPHKIFQRVGANLLLTVNVTLQESVLGTNVTVNTLDGRTIRVNITSIISPDYTKIVYGEGLPLAEIWRQRGDLMIRFEIQFPLYLNVSAKNDLEKVFEGDSKYSKNNSNEGGKNDLPEFGIKMQKYEETLCPMVL